MNFTDVLSKPAAEVIPPRPLPVGTYLAIVDGQPEITKVGKNQTDCINFHMKLMQAQGDVDQAALVEALNGKALADYKVKHTLWGTNDPSKIETVRYFITEFLSNDLGIEKGDRTIGQMLPEAMGKQVLLTIGHRPSEDGKIIYLEVKGTAKV